MKKVNVSELKKRFGLETNTKCRKCGRFSYGFPLCSWCRRKENEGRVEVVRGEVRFVMWNRRAKVFEGLTAEEVKKGAWK